LQTAPPIAIADEYTPLTGNGHILLRYQPYMHNDFVHMGHMDFFHKDGIINVNPEHYYPSFIAKDVEELRENRNTRKMLRKYRIFDGPENEIIDDENTTWKIKSPKESDNDTISKKTKKSDEKSKKNDKSEKRNKQSEQDNKSQKSHTQTSEHSMVSPVNDNRKSPIMGREIA